MLGLIAACKAVLLFHSGSPWNGDKPQIWFELTGSVDATTRVLCDFVRAKLAEAEQADDRATNIIRDLVRERVVFGNNVTNGREYEAAWKAAREFLAELAPGRVKP